jgi:hypothetical protein
MNPYLEHSDTWEDFHTSFITHARDALSPQVGPNYLVKIEVRIYLRELSEEERHYFGRADVAMVGRPQPASAPAQVLTAPMQLSLPAVETYKERSLEIYDRQERRIVTVLELLSPANKTPGPDHNAYLGKRRSVLGSRTHLVEIDLRRGGSRPTLPQLPTCDYYALVSRYEDRPDKLDMWPIRLRERLPVIPIPLNAPDPPVPLDLQALLDRIYDAADYGKYIYAAAPQPPLLPDDAAWARSLVPAQG